MYYLSKLNEEINGMLIPKFYIFYDIHFNSYVNFM